ncbi:MAG: DUF2258 domain-containing protein [Candidatus Nanopusillus sp.]
MSSSHAIAITTGPVRASGYALRFRRAAYAAARAHLGARADALDAEVARVNKAVYDALVALGVPKGTVLVITAALSVEGDRPRISDVRVDVLHRDDVLSEDVTKAVADELARA